MQKWDPIGVKNEPEAADEYDSYVGAVCGMIWADKSTKEITTYLSNIEREHMGLSRDDSSIQAHMKPVIEEIQNIFSLHFKESK